MIIMIISPPCFCCFPVEIFRFSIKNYESFITDNCRKYSFLVTVFSILAENVQFYDFPAVLLTSGGVVTGGCYQEISSASSGLVIRVLPLWYKLKSRVKQLRLRVNISLHYEASCVHDVIAQTWLMGAFNHEHCIGKIIKFDFIIYLWLWNARKGA